MRKILFVMFAWAICANLVLGEFGELGKLQWHKCENIFDDDRQDESTPKWRKTTLQWRKCGGESALSRHTELSQESEVSKSHESNKNYESNSQSQNNELNNDLALQDYDSRDLASSGLDSSLVSLAQNDGEGESHNDKMGESVESRNDDSGKSNAMDGESTESHNDKVSKSLNAKMGESSGIILGLGISYHNFRFTQNYEQIVSEIKAVAGATGADAREVVTTTTQLEPPISLKAGSGGGSIMFGYQGLSAPFSEMVQLGIRVYGDLSATKIHFSDNIAPTMLRYGLNADMLLDFILGQNLWLGLFAGVRIGGTSYLGDDIKAINKRLNALNNGSFPKGSFDFAVNVGLRTNITQNSGVELVFAIPVYQMNYKASSEKVDSTTKTTATSLSGAFKEQWSASVRYVWAFSTK